MSDDKGQNKIAQVRYATFLPAFLQSPLFREFLIMATRVEALVNPDILIWARNSAGLDVETAANKIPVKEDRLTSWEAGSARPTAKQLRKHARAYKRPLSDFFLPNPPRDFQPMHAFRLIDGNFSSLIR